MPKLVSLQSAGSQIAKVWQEEDSLTSKYGSVYRIEIASVVAQDNIWRRMLPQIFYTERPAIHFASNCLAGVA